MNFKTLFAAAIFFLAFMPPSLAQDATFPWKAGDTPPTVAGIALGDTEQHVLDILGKPTSTAPMGPGTVYDYDANGLEVIVTKADGVSIIRLRTPTAGSIGGIKVGDDASAVEAKWGNPSDGQGRTALFTAGVWTVAVRLADNGPAVVDISLAWNMTKWPDTDPSKAKAYRPQ